MKLQGRLGIPVAILSAVALLVTLSLLCTSGCAKRVSEAPAGPPAGMSMAPAGPPAGGDHAEAEQEAAPGAARGPRGSERAAPPADQPLDKDAYYSSTYIGGTGERDRIEKMIEEGVVVDGKTIKLAAFTREYSHAFEIPTSKALNLHVDLERDRIATDGGPVHLQVGLQAIKREAPTRAKINLCLVIDRSGSMADENKLDYARKAAIDIIERLEPTDRLAIVAYDDRARVLRASHELTDEQSARQRVRQLTPGGSTNIYQGLTTGYRQVQNHIATDAVNQVILLSDGLVTAGTEDPNSFRRLALQMAENDIQTTSVGMGVDFDETIMAGVARAGRGSYHFLKNPGQIRDVFRKELGNLKSVVAKAVKIRIVLPDGVQLSRVLGSSALSDERTEQVKRTEQQIDRKVYEDLGIQRDREKLDEPGVKTLIPHFYAGDSHVMMLRIRVPAGSDPATVARVELKYKDLVFRKNRKATDAARIEYTSDKSEVVASVNRDVKKNVLGFQTGEALLTASQYLEQGRPGDAAEVIDDQMVVLGVAAREWHDRDLDEDGRLLDRYKQVIASVADRRLADSDLGKYLSKSLSYSGYELTR